MAGNSDNQQLLLGINVIGDRMLEIMVNNNGNNQWLVVEDN